MKSKHTLIMMKNYFQKKEKSGKKILGCDDVSGKEESLIEKQLQELNYTLRKNRVIDLIELLGNTKQVLFRNLWAGIAKGIGIGIGFTIMTAIIILILQRIVTLNIPVIGEYIADIVDIVEKSR